ncbi:MAG: hypothetical protein QOI29_5016 [Mycobacterium sp.]|nr:hypothetical protein [Mycobacterium sp.]
MQARRRAHQEFSCKVGPGRHATFPRTCETAVKIKNMVIRVIGVASVGLALLLAGCGAVTRPAAAPTPTVSDEVRIGEVIARVSQAHASSDHDNIAALTCAKYRDQADAPSPDDVPPMNALPLDVFSTMSPETLAERLGVEYAGASAESLRVLADALIRRDEAAYTDAMAEVMAQTMKVRVDKLENVVVNGDTATADASLVIGTGGKMSYTTDVSQFTLVKEDGRWKDCTPQDDE